MDGNHDLALQVLSHAQNVDGGHLVLHADGVLTEGAEGHVDVVILTVLCEVDGEVGVTGVIDVAAGGLDQVVNSLVVHVGRADAGQLFTVLIGLVGGDDAGTVEAVQSDDFQILDLDGVAGLDGDAAISGNAPLDPQFNTSLGADEGNGNNIAVLVGGGHAAVDDVSSPLSGHMVLMVVGSQNSVHLLECEGIEHEGNIAQVGLHQAAAAHVCHLVANSHLAVAVGTLTVAAPQVDGDVGVAGSLEPDAGAAQPPHSHIAGGDNFIFDVLDQPGAPLGEGALDPRIASHFGYFAHNYIPPSDIEIGLSQIP